MIIYDIGILQKRSKNRVSDLKYDLQCSIFDAEEFRKSVLLHGIRKTLESLPSASPYNFSKLDEIPNHKGSALIKEFTMHVDSVIPLINSDDTIKTDFENLRLELVQLLLAESKAIKFYAAECIAYFLDLSIQLDNLDRKTEIVTASMKQYREKLELGMYKIPKNSRAEICPVIFRRRVLKPLRQKVHAVINTNLDIDGLEMIEDSCTDSEPEENAGSDDDSYC